MEMTVSVTLLPATESVQQNYPFSVEENVSPRSTSSSGKTTMENVFPRQHLAMENVQPLSSTAMENVSTIVTVYTDCAESRALITQTRAMVFANLTSFCAEQSVSVARWL